MTADDRDDLNTAADLAELEALENEAEDQDSDGKRSASAIQFPYGDLVDAIEVARVLFANAGASLATWEHIAAWLGHGSASSGGFRTKIATARIFGFTETKAGGALLTTLGGQILDPARERAARVTAFLNVPLYRAIYDNHVGMTLPPDAGLEREMVSLGVSAKQKERARQIFQRSADQAGFFTYGRNKLVLPVVEVRLGRAELPEGLDRLLRGGVAEDPTYALPAAAANPLIAGLMQSLPQPGMAWPKENQEHWLATAAHVFGLVYPPGQEPAGG